MQDASRISFHGIDRFYQEHREDILRITDEVYKSGAVLMGKEVGQFEEAIAAYCSRKYAVAVGSCTDALFFSLQVGGVGKGDEVLVTCFSYLASATPILRAGARPVFVDINPATHQMDVDDLKSKITPSTKAIIAVELYGLLVDMDRIEAIAKEHELLLIEDAAQSLGSSNNGRQGGSMGKISCISFDPTKIIGAFGNGGVVLTDDRDLNRQLQAIRYHGKNTESGQFEELGYNSRMGTVQAALLNFQLSMLPDIIERRNEIASIYNRELGNIEGLEILARNKQSQDNYHKYVLKTDKRDELKNHLAAQGIQANAHYDHLIPDLPIFTKENCESADLDNAESIKDKVLSLPIYPGLTNEEIERVCSEIDAVL